MWKIFSNTIINLAGVIAKYQQKSYSGQHDRSLPSRKTSHQLKHEAP